MPVPERSDVTIGIVTATTTEYDAMRALLIEPVPVRVPRDANSYDLARLPGPDPHTSPHVALLLLTQDGTRSAAASCTDLVRSFPRTRCVITCGIAGGVPATTAVPATAGPRPDVRLGDVVVATEVIDYGHVRSVDGQDELRRPLPRGPSLDLIRAANQLDAKALRGDRSWERPLVAATARSGALSRFAPPPGAGGGLPAVHRGRVASGDRLVRDAAERDRIAAAHRVIAIEMEATGIAVAAARHNVDWFMIRGITDYCDADKNDRWHPFGSLAAAAYLVALVGEWPTCDGTSGAPVNFEIRRQLLDRLLEVSAIAAPDTRHAVINALPPMIRDAVRRHPAARVEVLGLINTCFEYPGGWRSLANAIRLVEGDSLPLRRLLAVLEPYLTDE